MEAFRATRTIKRKKNTKISVVKKINHKKTNGKREAIQLQRIIYHIKNNTPQGLKLKTEFEKVFNEKITDIEVMGGRSAHYDLIIYTNLGREYKVEYKGSMIYSKINPEEPPWKTGIQFSNGNPKSFKLCEIYAQEWFNVLNRYIEEHDYSISAPRPTFEEYKKSVFKQAKNKQPYILEFLERYRSETGKDNLAKERTEFNKIFAAEMINEEVLEDLRKDISHIYQKSMKDKEIWLQIHGEIDSDHNLIDIKWTKGMSPEQLESRQVKKITIQTSTPDIKFSCDCGPEFKFEAHLRWGYYIGVGNLRIDFK